MKTLWLSLNTFFILSLLLGIVYPAVITGISAVCFHEKANGSVILKNDAAIGSELFAQQFDSPQYFYARPSAVGYATVASGSSNQGPTSRLLHDSATARRMRFAAENGVQPQDVPADMLFASGSGLDPHISPEAARLQLNRVAAARGLTGNDIRQLATIVDNAVEQPEFGLFGQARVNVLLLNLAVDKLFGDAHRP